MKLALIGAGARGMVYSRYAHDSLGAEIVAAADPIAERCANAQKLFGIPQDKLFSDSAEMLRAGIEADALIVASMDRDHYGHAMAGLEQGFPLLLEKPISPDPLECLKVQKKAEEKIGKRKPKQTIKPIGYDNTSQKCCLETFSSLLESA